MKNLENKKLIKQLEVYRLENKISQEKLAKMLDVTFCTVNRWLNFKNFPNKIQRYHIEKFLKKGGKYHDKRKRGSYIN